MACLTSFVLKSTWRGRLQAQNIICPYSPISSPFICILERVDQRSDAYVVDFR